MSKLIEEIKWFWSKKCFVVGILLVTIFSYITLLMNPTVSIDDTAFKVYFIDGVAPAMGRWCLYLIHKLFHLDYNPYFVEAIGLLFFCVSVSLWCVVFRRLFGDKISIWGYTIFGAVMISSPMISEIVVWYLQNGLYLGYGVTALAILFFMDAFRMDAFCEEKPNKRKIQIIRWLLSAVTLTIAVGFYESFMIVFLMAAVMVFLLVRVLKHQNYQRNPFLWFGNIVGVTVGAMLLRTLIVKLVIAFFGLESQKDILKSRGLYEVLGWFDGTRNFTDFIDVMKEYLVKYCFHGIVYLPVLLLVLAEMILIGWGIWQAFRCKDAWIVIAVAGILLLPFIMPVLEGEATFYRAAQYVPLLTAFAVLVVAWWIAKCHKRIVKYVGAFLAFLLLYQQCYEMNKWLYVDALKYEDAKHTMDAVALKIMEECDESKPVCVIGHYETPQSLLEEVYCPSWSKKYRLVSFLVKGLDEELFDKYNTSAGYAAAETPKLSVINWGATAFYGFDRELIKFWKMHGYSFTEDGNQEHYVKAKELMKDGPVWPEDGSIVEMQDHIVVNFGNL